MNLRIVDESQKKADEKFEVVKGIPVKSITAQEYSEILNEYNQNKKPYQREITRNEDGTYSLPMNFPVGLADIEQYVDMSSFKGGKEEFIQTFAKIPRMYFIGENEEEKEGHFAYSDGRLQNGTTYKSGVDLDSVEDGKKASELYDTEKASMHNRVMDYIAVNRILFGQGKNDKWNNYIELAEQLGMNAQSKIYKDVGHVDIGKSEAFKKDSGEFYTAIDSGEEFVLGDNDRASEVNPIYQLKRRFLVSRSKEEYDSKVEYINKIPNELLEQSIDELIARMDNPDGKNRYQLMDSLTIKDLEYCFKQRVLELSKQQSRSESKLSKSGIAPIAKKDNVVMEKENEQEAMSELERTPEIEKENSQELE